MCPACIANAALLVGGVTTTAGGLTALIVKIFLVKPGASKGPEVPKLKEDGSWQEARSRMAKL